MVIYPMFELTMLARIFTGHDLTRVSGREVARVGSGPVRFGPVRSGPVRSGRFGSDQEILKLSRVRSGRVGSGRVNVISPDPT